MEKPLKNFFSKLWNKRPVARLNERIKELESKNEKLEKDVLRMKNIFSLISHDLRGPFNPILGLTEILVSECESMDVSRRKKYINVIHERAANVFNLLTNLLDWSRSQIDQSPVVLKRLDLKEIADSTLDLFRSGDNKKNVDIVNKITSGTIVEANPDIVAAVIRNLISNSLKFTNSGGMISISESHNETTISVSVTDTGVGIEPENLKKLFGPELYTTRGTREEKGTGLGLRLCRELIERQGGRIFVKSSPNHGTTITFTLKAADRN